VKQVSLDKKDLDILWKEFKAQGSTEARDALIINYLGLVKYIAGRMALASPSYVEEDDLIGWGVLGLMDATEKFNLDQKTSFETYASVRIRGSILDQIRSLDWAPRSLRRKARQLKEAHSGLKDELGREPSDTELAARLDMTDDMLFHLKSDVYGAYMISLDNAVSTDEEENELTLAEVTGGTSPSPEDSAARNEAEQRLAEVIQRLPEQERQVITLYYFDELTLKEIGELLHVSESRVCQIHRAVIKKLQRHLQIGLRDAYS